MLIGLKDLAHRNAPTLAEDAAGCLALVVILVVGLHLPTLI